MWFAALGSYEHNPWFVSFVYRLLEGQKDGNTLIFFLQVCVGIVVYIYHLVLPTSRNAFLYYLVTNLLDKERLPFPANKPPKYIRAILYKYSYTPSTSSK